MISIIAIVKWLISKMSTYPELDQIQNWQNKKKKNVRGEPFVYIIYFPIIKRTFYSHTSVQPTPIVDSKYKHDLIKQSNTAISYFCLS